MLDISFAGAALAGLLSFFTPCILPMVPFYLCYMAGISMNELTGEGRISQGAQRRLVVSAIAFAFGVTTIFILLGVGVCLRAVQRDTQLSRGGDSAGLRAAFPWHCENTLPVS